MNNSNFYKTSNDITQLSIWKFSLFDVGFRPFYLLGSLYAAILIPLWASIFLGQVESGVYLSGLEWHMHETIFGFFPAIMVGFLFTAIPHWTNVQTPKGILLACLSLYYVIARILLNTPYYFIGIIFDISFLYIIVVCVSYPIIRSRNYRNFPIILIVLYLAMLNTGFHLDLVFQQGKMCKIISQISLDLITLLIAGIGGRTIPQFTQNAFLEIKVRKWKIVEYLSLLSLLAILILDSFLINHNSIAYKIIIAIAFASNFIRFLGWRPFATLSNPIVWILHASYGWFVISLALKLLSNIGIDLPYSIDIHAFTVGTAGGMMIALMTRSSRGHTGRELKVGYLEIIAYISIQLSALFRVIFPLIKEEYFLRFVQLSSFFWCLAFGLFFVRFFFPLISPRIDKELV